MKRRTDHLATARKAWGARLPDWVEALARLATEKGLKKAAAATGLSAASVSTVIANKYGARTDNVRHRVRIALDLDTVECPVLGTIKASECVGHRRRGASSTNMIHVKLSRTCPSCTQGYPLDVRETENE